MRHRISNALMVAAVFAALPTAAQAAGQAGYVWANEPTAASYTPDSFYQYNTAGRSNTITRLSTGGYEITFAGLGAPGGTVDVTAYQTHGLCKTENWEQVGSDELVDVVCFDNAGNLADQTFDATYTQPTSTSGRLAYLWDGSPTVPEVTPNVTYQYNSAGGFGSVARASRGVYTVTFPNQGLSAGTVKATAYGAQPTTCQTVNWGPSGADQAIRINCFGLTGHAADSDFEVTFAANTNVLSIDGLHTAYLWSGAPSSSYTYNDTGGAVHLGHPSTGEYQVTLGGQGVFGDGDIQVTPYGASGRICNSGGWSPSQGNLTATVQCYTPAGAIANTKFTLQWISN